MSSSSPTKVVVEYAKSGRSSCKNCQTPISANSLRLGLVSKGPQGFAMTKWQHLDCFFKKASSSVFSAEAIKGFSALESIDQLKLKKLVGKCVKSADEVSDGDEDAVEESEEKESKVCKEDYDKIEKRQSSSMKSKLSTPVDEAKLDISVSVSDAKNKHKLSKKDDEKFEDGQRSSKNIKLTTLVEEAKLDIYFSVSEVKNKYKDATLLPRWKAFQTLIFLERDDDLRDSSKIAAFDFDGCLVNTSVKRVGPNDWSLLYPSIPDKLRSLYNVGYKLVIFTNESNIERWKNARQRAVDSKIGRLNSFIKLVKVPIQVFIACGIGKSGGQPEDPYRKPNTGMWRIMEQHFNSGILINMNQSFYVGDAAGRKNDHSDADIKFAQTIGLKFNVPEDYFITFKDTPV